MQFWFSLSKPRDPGRRASNRGWLVPANGWPNRWRCKTSRRKWQEQVVCYAPVAGQKLPRALAVGLGKREMFDLDKWRGAVAAGLRKCRDLRLGRPALAIMTLNDLPFLTEVALQEALIGGLLGLYRF